MIDLLKTSTISLQPGPTGDYDENGDWTSDVLPDEVDIQASVQPFWRQSSNGKTRVSLPEGVRVEDVRVIYTKDEIKTSGISSKREADRITLEDTTYYAYLKRNWTLYGLSVDHFEVFFIRDDETRESV
jgi:hypothetical protein